jgi:hypothetical protein
VEIHINIVMVDVNVTMSNHQLSEREMKILEVLLLNLSAQTNAQITKEGMALNPLEKKRKDEIFHYQLAWQSSILPEQYQQIQEGLSRRFTNAIKMCGLSDIDIKFKEHSYSNR